MSSHTVVRAVSPLALSALLSAPAAAQTQDPIHLVIDLHADPLPNTAPVDVKLNVYQGRVANAEWVLDQTDPVGARVSFLASGQFMELVAGGGPTGDGAALLRRLYASGQQIGSHSHQEYRAGVLDWPNVADPTSYAAAEQSWTDDVTWVNAAIETAFWGSPPEPLAAINCVKGAHLPKDEADYHSLMSAFAMQIREPGPEEDYFGVAGHHIWHPYRPSPIDLMCEEPTAPFVQVTQGSVIGVADVHHGVFQDMTAGAVKRQFVQLYLNWRHRDRTGLPPKVWCWGWGGHAYDFAEDGESRAALVDVLAWLDEHFADRVEPTGSHVLRWSTHREAAADFVAWESAHPGTSSFDGCSAYPWLEPVRDELRDYAWSADLALSPGTDAFLFERDGREAAVLWRAGGLALEDLHSIFGGPVRVVGLETGAVGTADATHVLVGAEPLMVTAEEPRTALRSLSPSGTATHGTAGKGL